MYLFACSQSEDWVKRIVASTGVPVACPNSPYSGIVQGAMHQGVVQWSRFADGEVDLQLLESVRDKDTVACHTLACCPNRRLVELLLLVDALRRSGARRITALVPYLAYSRQDRQDRPGVPISARVVANMLERVGVDRLVTVDLHTEQVEGFFDIPVTVLSARPLLLEAATRAGRIDAVVAPDIGSIRLASQDAEALGVPLVLIGKHRGVRESQVEVRSFIGDVKGKRVLLADDLCSTGSTLVSAAKACRERGAEEVIAAVTHSLLRKEAVEAIAASPLHQLIVSDSVALTEEAHHCSKIQQIPLADLLRSAL